jgi:nucleotide-binding universal stress UspA family protein
MPSEDLDLYQPGIVTRYWETARKDAERELSMLSAEATRAGVKNRFGVELGRAPDQILKVATEEEVSLIVVATAGRGGARRTMFGSVADDLVRRAPCPVLTAGPIRQGKRSAQLKTLLYPTDFSPTAEAAWPLVEALALASGGQVILLHIMPEVPDDSRISVTERAKLESHYRRRAEESAAALLSKSRLPQSRTRVVLGHDVPGEEIVNRAAGLDADVIVMGTHGWSGLLSWALGSVARHVIQAAPCPVLTVNPEGRKEVHRHVTS